MPVGVSPREYSQPSLPYKQTKWQSVEGSNRSSQKNAKTISSPKFTLLAHYAFLRNSKTKGGKHTGFLPWRRACPPHTFPATWLCWDRRVPPGQGSFPLGNKTNGDTCELRLTRPQGLESLLGCRRSCNHCSRGGCKLTRVGNHLQETHVNWIGRPQNGVS